MLTDDTGKLACTLLQGSEEQFNCEYDCLDTVIAAGVCMHFHDESSPEFPELYIRAL